MCWCCLDWGNVGRARRGHHLKDRPAGRQRKPPCRLLISKINPPTNTNPCLFVISRLSRCHASRFAHLTLLALLLSLHTVYVPISSSHHHLPIWEEAAWDHVTHSSYDPTLLERASRSVRSSNRTSLICVPLTVSRRGSVPCLLSLLKRWKPSLHKITRASSQKDKDIIETNSHLSQCHVVSCLIRVSFSHHRSQI